MTVDGVLCGYVVCDADGRVFWPSDGIPKPLNEALLAAALVTGARAVPCWTVDTTQ